MGIQLFFNIALTFSVYLILALSFSISYEITKSFDLNKAAIISFAAYISYLIFVVFHLPKLLAILFSVVFSIIISVFIENKLFYVIRKNKSGDCENGNFRVLIASIGVYTIFQNALSLYFGDEIKTISGNEFTISHELLGAYITDIQIITIFVSTVLFVSILLLLHKTRLGRQIRAVSNNPELCNIYGIDSDKVVLWATAISSALAAIAGILIALDLDMTPTFGFNYFLCGVVAMIIGGVGSYRGLVFGSLLLASAQHLAAYYIDTKWMDAVAYLILILFLIWKPLGFSGLRFKKIDI